MLSPINHNQDLRWNSTKQEPYFPDKRTLATKMFLGQVCPGVTKVEVKFAME